MSEQIDEATFVQLYADVETGHALGDRKLTLATVVAMESLACTARDQEGIRDPAARLHWLAKAVGEHLLPEHQYLLVKSEI